MLDPSFRGTSIETAARSLGCAVDRHPGYRMGVDALPVAAGYRDPGVLAAAERLMEAAALPPAVLSDARPVGAIDAGTAERVWHLLARFGRR